MSKGDIDIDLLGDDELLRVLSNLEYKTQHKELKKIVRDVATKVLIPPLRRAHPYSTISKSMGVKSGRSKKNAVAFAGPRMGGTQKQRQSGRYDGWLANIVEHNKGQNRYPGEGSLKSGPKKRPNIPGYGVRMHSGKMPLAGKGRINATLESNIHKAASYFNKSVRAIIEKEWKRFNKGQAL